MDLDDGIGEPLPCLATCQQLMAVLAADDQGGPVPLRAVGRGILTLWATSSASGLLLFRHAAAELANALAEAAGQLRDLVGAEQEDQRQQYEQEFLRA
jgi:hypothetical protein